MNYRVPAAAVVILCLANTVAAETKSYQAYPGAELPTTQVATLVLHPESERNWHGRLSLGVAFIDGLRVGQHFGPTRFIDTISFLPGKHKMTFVLAYRSLTGYAYLWFEAKAGKSYSAKTHMSPSEFRVWIEDDETSTPVGGVQGGEDEPANAVDADAAKRVP